MNNNTRMPFIRTSREFPDDLTQLSAEVNKAYVDIANSVNNRTIGIYSVSNLTSNGNSYFISNKRQQGVRKMYTFSGTGNIELGFKVSSVYKIINIYGTYTATVGGNLNTFGLIPGSNVAIAGQISFFILTNTSPTNSDVIQFVLGAGSPTLVEGVIVIECIANV